MTLCPLGKVTRPIQEAELRYKVPADRSVFAFDIPAGTNPVLYCIKDKSTGSKRYELEDALGARPAVPAINADAGSPGFAAAWFLPMHLQCRVIFLRDVYHRCWNDCKLAIQEQGWRWCILQLLLVMNVAFGPWLSESWWVQMQGAAERAITALTPASSLLIAMRPRIMRDVMDSSPEPAGEDHVQKSFDVMSRAWLWKAKGKRVSPTRWFSWLDAYKAFDPIWYSVLLVVHPGHHHEVV